MLPYWCPGLIDSVSLVQNSRRYSASGTEKLVFLEGTGALYCVTRKKKKKTSMSFNGPSIDNVWQLTQTFAYFICNNICIIRVSVLLCELNHTFINLSFFFSHV